MEGSGSRSVKDFGLLVFVLNAPSSLVTHDTHGATCAPKAAPTTVPFFFFNYSDFLSKSGSLVLLKGCDG